MNTASKPRACPFYIVCDVSQSMWKEESPQEVTPFSVLSSCVDQLMFQIESDPTVSEAAHVSVISFADEANIVLPLTKLENATTIEELKKGSQTNYEAVFRRLRSAIEIDCDKLSSAYNLKQPTIFFLTDGGPYVGSSNQPESVWTPPRDDLVDRSFRYRPNIVAFGFRSVSESTLCRLATSVGLQRLAFIADRAIQVSQLVQSIMDALFVSIGQSVAQDEFVVETPEGMRRAHCGQTGGV